MVMKQSTPDKLSLDAMAARSAHMTYGKYMAMKHPVTVNIPVKEPGEGDARCKNCGIIFKKTKHFRVVCSGECRTQYYRDRNREYMTKNRYKPDKED